MGAFVCIMNAHGTGVMTVSLICFQVLTLSLEEFSFSRILDVDYVPVN
jgi:hypothetical protein